MAKKSDLLKQLGWNNQLIQHFMVVDTEYTNNENNQLKVEVYDSSSLKVSLNSEKSGSTILIRIKH